jgi:hypothetical protein
MAVDGHKAVLDNLCLDACKSWLALQRLVATFDVRTHPFAMIEHPSLIHFDFALDVQVATLAKRG